MLPTTEQCYFRYQTTEAAEVVRNAICSNTYRGIYLTEQCYFRILGSSRSVAVAAVKSAMCNKTYIALLAPDR